ncbi:MAG: sodium:solute symporter family transporter, partial [Tannerellaceae bacterium]
AALTAAIISSLASMMNSISTIFTMDVYKEHIDKTADQKQLVRIGKMTSFASIMIAACIVPLLSNLDQAFQYIQEFTGFISPGALTIFLAGFFYKKATANGALCTATASIILSVAFKLTYPLLPWMDRMGIVFLCCIGIIVAMGKRNTSGETAQNIISFSLFKTERSFNLTALVVICILSFFYAIWW